MNNDGENKKNSDDMTQPKAELSIELKGEIDKLSGRIDQVENEKDILLTLFSILASLIAFFTLEFKFLQSLYSWEKILGFSFLFVSLLLIFNIAFFLLLKQGKEVGKLWPLYIIVGLLFFGGYYFIPKGNEEAAHKEYIYQQAYDTFKENQAKLYMSYDQKLDELFSDIRNMKHEIEKFKLEKTIFIGRIMDVEVKKSNIGQFEDGLGVFAVRDFKKDEVVLKWNLRVLSESEYNELSGYERQNFCHKRSGNIYLYPDPERHVNRSHNPNVYADFEKEADIALRDIKKGDELSIAQETVEDF